MAKRAPLANREAFHKNAGQGYRRKPLLLVDSPYWSSEGLLACHDQANPKPSRNVSNILRIQSKQDYNLDRFASERLLYVQCLTYFETKSRTLLLPAGKAPIVDKGQANLQGLFAANNSKPQDPTAPQSGPCSVLFNCSNLCGLFGGQP